MHHLMIADCDLQRRVPSLIYVSDVIFCNGKLAVFDAYCMWELMGFVGMSRMRIKDKKIIGIGWQMYKEHSRLFLR